MDRCEHTDRPVAARCVACGKRLCQACRVWKGGRNWCADCAPGGKGTVRSPVFSMILSLVPGLGQIYGGAPVRGLLFLAAGAGLAAFHTRLPAAAILAFWCLTVWDARMTALRRNEKVTGGKSGIRGPGDGDRLLVLGTGLLVLLYTVLPATGAAALSPLSLWAAFAVVVFLSLIMGRGERNDAPQE